MATEDRAREVKSRHSAQLLQQPGVSGVGVEKDDEGNFFITLYLDTKDPEVEARLPRELEGLPVKIIHGGPFRKF
jgi:hypothetical protein